ncbi:glycosyltransferase [Rhizobium johnstonii]|uniref:glycosyltransferase n=1 Tax=Rhizobium johnstonii TaxID=3019933 RepID=UPI003F9BD5A5
MKILIASTPATGHLNPLLAVTRLLLKARHEVVVMTADFLKDRVEETGARFECLPPEANLDMRRIENVIPEIADYKPGPERRLLLLERIFIDVVPAQASGLAGLVRKFSPDAILVDNTFFGVLPMLLQDQEGRPAVAICGTMFLHAPREDGAPTFLGLPPAETDEDKRNYASLAAEQNRTVNRPALSSLNRHLGEIGSAVLDMNFHDAMVLLPDAFLQMTVPSFEYPRKVLPPSVEFVGILPIVPGQASIPEWADEIDGSRKVVLVTQGTVSNIDFSQLVIPTLQAMADDEDVMVVLTTGGRDPQDVHSLLPSNARCSEFLPFEWLLPKVDLLVTNGGYGNVNQALAYGIPIIGAGVTEDKGDVNARIAWSGAGIDLRTSNPSAAMLGSAIRKVLGDPSYRYNARAIGRQFAAIDTAGVILARLEKLAAQTPREISMHPQYRHSV